MATTSNGSSDADLSCCYLCRHSVCRDIHTHASRTSSQIISNYAFALSLSAISLSLEFRVTFARALHAHSSLKAGPQRNDFFFLGFASRKLSSPWPSWRCCRAVFRSLAGDLLAAGVQTLDRDSMGKGSPRAFIAFVVGPRLRLLISSPLAFPLPGRHSH